MMSIDAKLPHLSRFMSRLIRKSYISKDTIQKKSSRYEILNFTSDWSKKVVFHWLIAHFQSPLETERTRFVDLYYYLVDDSISMTEPKQMNSGIPQGKFLTRQRLPTGQGDRVVHWKDLNCAMDLIVYGKVSLQFGDWFRFGWLVPGSPG